ncbi:RIP metalloprotease RseP [Thiocapsa roseopersicina]|uniref:Zinc metalloprotease n=1 Tax=Thiocapsa roseopersicina TaxID=1058 RepID=A0A1H2TNS0_THIRO|nr:RIP metalloprotease RseP [Thiocapsa roseopersicina]SDW44924.1 regulator of sigma E protease [Thiocapsa roseopersicina]
MDILFTIGSFVVALAILIAVHEFGHFWVARRLGVKVLRFSIGFGRPLLRIQRNPDATEYVVALVPLGGYVKMLDEREEEVPAAQAHLAFNRQALWKRSAIVVAGPVFNFLFAIFAYWAIFMSGDSGLRPIVGDVEPQSIAAEAGFQSGDELIRVGDREAGSWETALIAFVGKSLDGRELAVQVRDASGRELTRWIPSDAVRSLAEEPDLLGRLGLSPKRPTLPAVIGELVPGEAAEGSGLKSGDRILSADGRPIEGWQDWVGVVQEHPDETLAVEIERADGERLTLSVTPRSTQVEGDTIGRIGAGVLVPEGLMDDYSVEVRYGPVESLDRAVSKTVEMSVMTLRVVGRMLIGQASVENLSGPITIAETAGRTASYGLESFVKFLAVVSISLGILNLLPVPVLDGGHLLYFFIEWVKGSPLSEEAQMQGQRIGLFLLAALMSLAFYLDLSRLLG